MSRTVLWCLRTPRSRIRCILQPNDTAVEMLLVQNTDVAVRERFAHLLGARERADGLRERFIAKGWVEVSS